MVVFYCMIMVLVETLIPRGPRLAPPEKRLSLFKNQEEVPMLDYNLWNRS